MRGALASLGHLLALLQQVAPISPGRLFRQPLAFAVALERPLLVIAVFRLEQVGGLAARGANVLLDRRELRQILLVDFGDQLILRMMRQAGAVR